MIPAEKNSSAKAVASVAAASTAPLWNASLTTGRLQRWRSGIEATIRVHLERQTKGETYLSAKT